MVEYKNAYMRVKDRVDREEYKTRIKKRRGVNYMERDRKAEYKD